MDLVSIPAHRTYAEPARPFIPTEAQAPALTVQQSHDDLLDIADVSGKRQIATRLFRTVTVREENAAAALAVMSRFAVDPKWLVYLPPTMSPCETSQEPGLLEHPAEAFAYFRHQGVPRVLCEEKHMGSRAILIACRDDETARTRFGISEPATGICYPRTGRRFFYDPALEEAVLARVRRAMDTTGFWSEYGTDWACLDCEVMPWSAKAKELIRQQYAATGAAARAALAPAIATLQQARANGVVVDDLLMKMDARQEMAARYTEAYRRYCWPVESVDDLTLAPFQAKGWSSSRSISSPVGGAASSNPP